MKNATRKTSESYSNLIWFNIYENNNSINYVIINSTQITYMA